MDPSPHRPLTYDALLREHARSRPRSVAVVDGATRLTYPELDQRVDRLAAALAGLGVAPGDRVLWIGQNSFRVLELVLASARSGAIFCPANWRLSAQELSFVIEDLSPAVVVWQEAEIGDTVRAARSGATSDATWVCHDDMDGYERLVADSDGATAPRVDVDVDPASGVLAMYTAAFEGSPRAAVLSHTALLFQDLVIGRMQDVTDESVFLNSGPLFHVATFVTTSATYHHGGTNVFVPRVDPLEICRVVEAERCTHAFLMPQTIEQIRAVAGDHDLSSLWDEPDPARYRSGMVSPISSPWMQRPGGYGQTEVVGLTTLRGLGAESTGGAGRPSPVSLVRIVGPDGVDAEPGEVGEIVVAGPTVMLAYHGPSGGDRNRGGWHHTADLGRREPDGSISFVGPATRLIKSAAENIYPAEVEACLRQHDAVADVCVIGVPDATWRQSVRAVVVLRPASQADETELVDFCRDRIASYKKPRSVVFTDALPRTAAGALDRDGVDAAFGGGGYPGA